MFDPTYTDEWKRALAGADDALLKKLVRTEYPGTVLFQTAHFIMRQNYILHGKTDDKMTKQLTDAIGRALFIRKQVRSNYSWIERRRFDLEAVREFYSKRAVIPFLGAGVSIDAGGPSWPELVERLLLTALEPERQKKIPVPKKGGGWYFLKSKKVLHFDADLELQARQALEKIQEGAAGTELLMRTAQMCADLFQETFFSWVNPLLYENCPAPGLIHNAMAVLSSDKQKTIPGWSGIVTYNFDNLMGEALEINDRPYSVMTVRNGKGILSVPSDDSVYTEIIHVHGYVPRELMPIDGIQYVFSTSQYDQLYEAEKSALLNTIRMILGKADLFALYIGCSFTDTAMNNLLFKVSERRPGNYHFALLQLPKQFKESIEISEEGLAEEENHFLDMGIQPIWFRKFEDIPELILGLA